MVGAISLMAESKERRAFLKRNGLTRVGSSLVRDGQPVPSDEIDTLQKDWDAEWERNKDRWIAEGVRPGTCRPRDILVAGPGRSVGVYTRQRARFVGVEAVKLH